MATVGQGPRGWRHHPHIAPAQSVAIEVDGVRVEARLGECLAVALAVSGRSVLRHSPSEQTPRGMFCLMGSCQECVVELDGAAVLACMEAVRPGMRVTTDSLRRARPVE